MLYDINISSLLICYGPLALTILGFIGFAWRTDEDARRTYLRRMEMRGEDELPPVLDPVVKERVEAKTPSGSRVILVPDGSETTD